MLTREEFVAERFMPLDKYTELGMKAYSQGTERINNDPELIRMFAALYDSLVEFKYTNYVNEQLNAEMKLTIMEN